MVEIPIKLHVQNLAKQANAAARPLSVMPSTDRTQALRAMAEQLEASVEDVVRANKEDLDAIPKEGSMEDYRKARDQISLTDQDVLALVDSIRGIAEESDPVGEVTQGWLTQDGLDVHRVRVPVGGHCRHF